MGCGGEVRIIITRCMLQLRFDFDSTGLSEVINVTVTQPANRSHADLFIYYHAPPLIGGDIKRCFCLTSDVCL